MKDAVCSAVFQSLVRRVDDKRATMVVRYYIRGGLGRAGLRGWPSVEESLVGDVAIVWCSRTLDILYGESKGVRFLIKKNDWKSELHSPPRRLFLSALELYPYL